MLVLNHFVGERSRFIESKEGYTYIPKTIEERTSFKVLSYISSQEMTRWNRSMESCLVKMKTDPTDDWESDYVDFDRLVQKYIDHFVSTRNS